MVGRVGLGAGAPARVVGQQKVVLIKDGLCDCATKVKIAQENGAVAVNWTAAAGSFFTTRWDAQRAAPITTNAEPHRTRADGLLLVPSSMPYSSTCNAIASATAVGTLRGRWPSFEDPSALAERL